jgi:hypothetical protein
MSANACIALSHDCRTRLRHHNGDAQFALQRGDLDVQACLVL